MVWARAHRGAGIQFAGCQVEHGELAQAVSRGRPVAGIQLVAVQAATALVEAAQVATALVEAVQAATALVEAVQAAT
jgi:hypothetical protein